VVINRFFYILAAAIILGCFPVFIVAQTKILPPELPKSLSIGLRGEEVKKLQEFLAQDKEIYPEGLVTGYFGQLTRSAVQRFQCKNNIVCSGDEASTGYGRVGPLTRAKLAELKTALVVAPVTEPEAPSTSAIQPEPTPEVVVPPEPIAPAPAIKTGTGLVADLKNFKIGPVDFLYAGHYPTENRGYLYPGETSNDLANITSSEYSSCEDIAIAGYDGISDICQFTDPAKYKFSTHKEAVRIYDKNASTSTGYQILSCYQKILLFKEGNIYGAIDPEKIDFEGLHYRYWYDESGGSNFSGLCQQSKSATINKMASALESMRSLLENLKKLLK